LCCSEIEEIDISEKVIVSTKQITISRKTTSSVIAIKQVEEKK
jgi:hypothetical protein